MTFALIDDKFHSNPKVVAVGNAGAGLFARALSYCGDYLTDGFVTLGWVRETGSTPLGKKLADAGLWVKVTGGETFAYSADGETYTVTIPGPGYFIPDYLTLNPTRADVERKQSELSQKRAAAGRKGALARWQNDGKTDSKRDGKTGEADGKTMANAWQRDSPQPQPQPQEEPSPEQLRPVTRETGLDWLEEKGREIAEQQSRNHELAGPSAALFDQLDDMDDGSPAVIRSLLSQLPPYALPAVVHELQFPSVEIRSRTAYAVGLLQAMVERSRRGRKLLAFGKTLEIERGAA